MSGHGDFKFYHYDPSFPAAVACLVAFFLTTTVHFYQLLRTRTWYFIPFVIGGIFEWVGYIGRSWSAKQTPDWTLTPYIIQSLLLLVAPALLAASIYMELGRIILLLDGERHSIIKRTLLTKLFVLGDVLSFFVQGSGAGMMTKKDPDSVKAGSWIIVGGLILQILFFCLFILASVIFHLRIRRQPTTLSMSNEIPWQKHMFALYSASLLILIRSIFRTIEYVQGNNGYLISHEIYMYLFDALLMFQAMVIFNFVHPSEIKAHLRGGKRVANVFRMHEIPSRYEGVPDNAGSLTSRRKVDDTVENIA